MAIPLRHLRSDVPNKRPDPAAMLDGQLAMNQAPGSPGAFIKDSAGGLVKIGPTHIAPTAPNVTPAGSAGNTLGEQWLDTSTTPPVLKFWDRTAWVEAGGGSSEGPAGPPGPEGPPGPPGPAQGYTIATTPPTGLQPEGHIWYQVE
jgi:hypothetical protein